jgi:hypothetical protein
MIPDPRELEAELHRVRVEYNGGLLHSTLGYRSPAAYEATLHTNPAAQAA